jgi:hypothetical protein
MGVQDGEEHAVESRRDGPPQRLADLQFLLDALEDEDVGVHAHPDCEDQARNAWQCQGRTGQRHEAEEHSQVRHDREDGVDTGAAVIDQHERRHQNEAAKRRAESRVPGARAKRRPDVLAAEERHRHRQRARLQQQREVGRFFT